MANSTKEFDEFLTIQTASAKFPVHRNTLRSWCVSGKLQSQRAKKSMIVFKKSDLVKLMTERGFFVGV